MSEVTLNNHNLRLTVDTARGVNILAFFVHRQGAWLPVMPDTREGRSDLSAASFVMIPYSNRIEQGVFTFAGVTHRLADGANHAIHGDVRSRPWVIEQLETGRIACAFDSHSHHAVNWPWPFAATLTYALLDNVLSSTLSLRNLGETAMPAGCGWHPYFSRWLSREGEPLRLRMGVTGVYPDAHGTRIPSGPPQPPAPHQDFHVERELGPTDFLDACFGGYDGNGAIAWPESGVQLNFRCSAACTHLILYNPTGKPYFAVEPVTNANNGVNLLAQGQPDSGVVVLAPGEALQAQYDLQVVLR